jgi:hypothetical protein
VGRRRLIVALARRFSMMHRIWVNGNGIPLEGAREHGPDRLTGYPRSAVEQNDNLGRRRRTASTAFTT